MSGAVATAARVPVARGITFTGAMVRAALEGRKTQTRRVCRTEPWLTTLPSHRLRGPDEWSEEEQRYFVATFCPYGLPGDELWMRETWATRRERDHLQPSQLKPSAKLFFRADYKDDDHPAGRPWPAVAGRTRAAFHLPRWASRLERWLTNVRVQRIQEITHADILAEGVRYPVQPCGDDCRREPGAHEPVPGKGHALLRLTGPRGHAPAHYPPFSAKGGWKTATDEDYLRAEFAALWDTLHGDPKACRTAGVITHYVSHPWDGECETRTHRGKPWQVYGNPYVWALTLLELKR